jgi:hypothetical protein
MIVISQLRRLIGGERRYFITRVNSKLVRVTGERVLFCGGCNQLLCNGTVLASSDDIVKLLACHNECQ